MARPRKEIHTDDHQVGQDKPVEIKTEGELNVDRPLIETVEGPNAGDKAARLAFNEEMLTVMVHESADPNDPDPTPLVKVNGRSQYFIRGRVQTVRRKFVEQLARAKRTNFTQTVAMNNDTGNVKQLMNPRTALRYPFSVIEDKNPNGPAWLRKILAEG